jgi:S-adenosylmethionine hydrolase
MPIITLTTDLGTGGYYVGSVKAAILSEVPDATVVDITNSIQPFHVSAAAFIIRNVYNRFPKGTIHIVSVDSLNSRTSRFIAMQADGHYFIGADNGLFSLAINKAPDKVVEITIPIDPSHETFPARDVFARVACHLAKGGNLDTIGADYPDYVKPTAWQPTYDAGSITASILYVDHYGNCICNLDKALFQQVANGRSFLIDIKGYEVEGISKTYNEKGSGDIVALFSSTGLLELAMNHGDLSQILGLKEGDMIKIVFTS